MEVQLRHLASSANRCQTLGHNRHTKHSLVPGQFNTPQVSIVALSKAKHRRVLERNTLIYREKTCISRNAYHDDQMCISDQSERLDCHVTHINGAFTACSDNTT